MGKGAVLLRSSSRSALAGLRHRECGMNPDDAFERILESLYEAALDGARWPAASALVEEAERRVQFTCKATT